VETAGGVGGVEPPRRGVGWDRWAQPRGEISPLSNIREAGVYSDEDLLPLSALQHFLFCERQCALIHIEQVWTENLYTIEGELLHKRAHSGSREARPGKKTEFGMPIRSLELGLSGNTHAVEYGTDGSVFIVEYKRRNLLRKNGVTKEGLRECVIKTASCVQLFCRIARASIPRVSRNSLIGRLLRV
jgi:hypothetical protein